MADPAIISRDRLDSFLHDVFYNVNDLYAHHSRLIERFQEIQREEHPIVRSLTAAMFDAVLNFRDAYLEYVPNYPIAAYRIDSELANNPAFKAFHDVRTRIKCHDIALTSGIAMRPTPGRPQIRSEVIRLSPYPSTASIRTSFTVYLKGDEFKP